MAVCSDSILRCSGEGNGHLRKASLRISSCHPVALFLFALIVGGATYWMKSGEGMGLTRRFAGAALTIVILGLPPIQAAFSSGVMHPVLACRLTSAKACNLQKLCCSSSIIVPCIRLVFVMRLVMSINLSHQCVHQLKCIRKYW